MASGTVIGIDLGGTNVRATAFELTGLLLYHAQVPIEV